MKQNIKFLSNLGTVLQRSAGSIMQLSSIPKACCMRPFSLPRLGCGILMAVLSLGLTAEAVASKLSADDRRHLISEPRSGLALFGFDPVAYHIAGEAREGAPGVTAVYEGLTWRFVSASNRAVFLADPDAYIPRFGGHDGARMGEGFMVFGNPEHFLIAGGALVLFRSLENRDRYAADEALRSEARRRWPDVARQNALH
jgi:hypothetical protein